MDNPYAISYWFWLAIKDLCPGKVGYRGRTTKENRLFVDAVVYVIRSGMTWCLLPEEFGNFKCIHNRYMRWTSAGIRKRIFEMVVQDSDISSQQYQTDLDFAFQKNSTVSAHSCLENRTDSSPNFHEKHPIQ